MASLQNMARPATLTCMLPSSAMALHEHQGMLLFLRNCVNLDRLGADLRQHIYVHERTAENSRLAPRRLRSFLHVFGSFAVPV